MGIVAGLLVQNALKYLLEFGKVRGRRLRGRGNEQRAGSARAARALRRWQPAGRGQEAATALARRGGYSGHTCPAAHPPPHLATYAQHSSHARHREPAPLPLTGGTA